MKHYLFFTGGRGNHSAVYLARASTPLAAIQRYISAHSGDLTFEADGSIVWQYGRKTICYPHALAYIEAHEKVVTEWQIRELPEKVWEMEWTEDIFCGESQWSLDFHIGCCANRSASSQVTSGVSQWSLDFHIGCCRPILRQQFPRSRAPGFLWYLRDGTLVTFYRKTGPFQIEVLGRYLVSPTGCEGPEVTPWTGSYDELLEQLFILRWDWEREESRRAKEPCLSTPWRKVAGQ